MTQTDKEAKLIVAKANAFDAMLYLEIAQEKYNKTIAEVDRISAEKVEG